jgi:hypothetical protein
MSALLLIDNRVDTNTLFDKIKVDYIPFDFMEETYLSLIQKITEKNISYNTIGLFQNHFKENRVCFLNNECAIEWYGIQSFLTNLKIACPSLQNFDFCGSNVYNNSLAQKFEDIESASGVHVRASSSITANPPIGNWILESDGIDISTIYFNETISEWTGNLGI